MLKKILISLIVGMFILGAGRVVLTQPEETNSKTSASETVSAENVGNKICPVSGDKIDQNLKVTYEYEGKIYNFCCASCVEEFKKDPQKYIKKVEEELQAEPKEGMASEKETMPESEPSHSMHEGHQH